jgi:hypothetical protein
MSGERAALVFASPPYGNQRDYTTAMLRRRRASGPIADATGANRPEPEWEFRSALIPRRVASAMWPCSDRVEKIEADIKPLGRTVATMEPIVAGYAVTRWKIAGAFALGTSIITALGWVVSLFAGKIVAWIVSLFR